MLLVAGLLCLLNGGEQRVQVERVALYASPSFLAPVKAVLTSRDRVRVLRDTTGWKKVQVLTRDTLEGWLPGRALERPRLRLPGRTSPQGEDSRTVALASRGLQGALRRQAARYPEAHQALEHIDSLAVVALRDLDRFLKEGDLVP